MSLFSSRLPSTGRALVTVTVLGVLTAAAGVVQPAAAWATAQDQLPDAPTALSTVPASSCQGDTVLGDGDVTLSASVSSPDGGVVGVDFQVSRHATGDVVAETDPAKLTAPSGSAATYRIPRATLETAAGGEITEFGWKVRATDAAGRGEWSTTCHFSFDPTRPDAPTVALPGSTTIGQPVAIDVTGPTTGPVPSGYEYELNTAAPVDVPADPSGDATITLTPTNSVNTLTVTSLSPGGNHGGTAHLQFGSAEPPPALDRDLTGDGVPDLLTVGSRYGFPAGLWQAAGTGDGTVAASPTDIGADGAGFGSTGAPSDFDGAIAVTGRFTGDYEQDVLVYYPSGLHAGGGVILKGNGTGAPLVPGGSPNLSSGSLQDFNGDNPTQLVDAGNTSGYGTGLPDLIGVVGDPTNGYGLDLYPTAVPGGYDFPFPLSVDTPDGTADWNDWTLATTQLPTSGGGTSTAMFLWKKSTGELDLWENLAADPDTGSLAYDAYPVATGWNTGADVALQAADIDSDGVPDLWTVGAGATVTGNLVSGLSATGPATVTQVAETLDPVD